MTRAELIKALRAREYPETNARNLTNWRAKGLLPPLTKRGRGHGQGTHVFWTQPDILDRAIAVCEFMRQHRRTETALLQLWFAGFDVDAELIRSAWLKALDRDVLRIKRKADSKADREAVFTNMASAITKRQKFWIDRHTITDAVTEVLRAYYDEAYRLEIEAVFEPIATFIESALTSKNPTQDTSDTTSEKSIVEFFSFMSNVLALGATSDRIRQWHRAGGRPSHLGRDYRGDFIVVPVRR